MKNIKQVVALSEAVGAANEALDQAMDDVATNLDILEQLILAERAARAALDDAVAKLQAVLNPDEPTRHPNPLPDPPQAEPKPRCEVVQASELPEPPKELPEEDEDTESRTRTVIRPLWVGRSNRPTRVGAMRKGGDCIEAQYHNALYASIANGLGMGTHERYRSTSGKSHNGVWLTEVEHATVLSISGRMQKGDLKGFGVKEALLLVEGE